MRKVGGRENENFPPVVRGVPFVCEGSPGGGWIRTGVAGYLFLCFCLFYSRRSGGHAAGERKAATNPTAQRAAHEASETCPVQRAYSTRKTRRSPSGRRG